MTSLIKLIGVVVALASVEGKHCITTKQFEMFGMVTYGIRWALCVIVVRCSAGHWGHNGAWGWWDGGMAK